MEHSDAGKMPLDEYVGVVASIYSEHDSHRSIWDVWCHTLHHAAGVAEQIRKRVSNERLYQEVADFSLWLFTAISKLRGKFGESKGMAETPQETIIRIQSSCSELIWHKYPKLCPRCFAGDKVQTKRLDHVSPCDCPAERTANENDKARRKRIMEVRHHSDKILEEKPSSVDEWQEMFGAIFAKNLASLSPTDIVLHLMEELGEASDAIVRLYTYKEQTFRLGEPNWRMTNLEGQLADVFSWLFLLVEKLTLVERESRQLGKQISAITPIRAEMNLLSNIIWRRYGSDELGSFFCPFCKAAVCRCAIILVPGNRPIEELLQKFEGVTGRTD